MLSDKQRLDFKKILEQRFLALREEIRHELLQSDEERYIDLAGQVHDLEEEALADLLVDLGLAVLDLHIEEVRDIDAALLRIARGSYGVCIDCEADIALERLQAYPTAKRCRPCQVAYEHNHAGPGHPSL
jgi:RNA polymerase-binding transcription factor DksA